MNKDQFNLRHSNLNIDQNELNRKYSGYLQEQEEIEMRAMYEAFSAAQKGASSSFASSGGGGVFDENSYIEDGYIEYDYFI